MDLSRTTQQLTNMNIFTFVKEVYASLKHITNKLNKNESTIDNQHKKEISRLDAIEAKLDYIMQEQQAIKTMVHDYYNSDQNLGNDIQQKMENLLSTSSDFSLDNSKLHLQPEDLTLANVDESNYSFADIQHSIDTNNTPLNSSLTQGLLDNTTDIFESINLQLEDNLEEDLENDNDEEKNKSNEENIEDLVY